MRIYVDLDDVLAETGRVFLRVLRQEFGLHVSFEDVHSYDLGVSLGLEPASLTEFMHAVHRPEILARVEPMPGARRVVADWVGRGYEIDVVTGRPESTKDVSRKWLEAHDMPHHGLTYVDKYAWEEELFRTSTGVPLSRLVERDYCLAIEDSAEVAARLTGLLDAPVVLLDRPWNRRSSESERPVNGEIVRCRDWSEIHQRFPAP